MAVALEEARRLIRERIELKEKEEIPVLECVGRILAENIYTKIDQPPFRRAQMDGYAVRSVDTKGASKDRPVQLKVIDHIYAGTGERKLLGQNEAIRIMTGGMLPEGADCVVRQEDTDYGENKVSIYVEMQSGDFFSPIGNEFTKGTQIAVAGNVIDANIIATAVAAGLTELPVRKKVRAAVVTTGDELCRLGGERKEGQIYPSNMAYLCTRLKQLNCELVMMSQPEDKLETISDMIAEGVQKADVVITTGGVSCGSKDYLHAAVELAGAEVLFHGLEVNPGKPSMVSVYERKPIISLTGNPYSAEVVFELLIHSVLSDMQGTHETDLSHVHAVAEDDFPVSSIPCRSFIRGYFEDGKVYRMNKQSKSSNFAGIGCNCLLDMPAEAEMVTAGDQVQVYLL